MDNKMYNRDGKEIEIVGHDEVQGLWFYKKILLSNDWDDEGPLIGDAIYTDTAIFETPPIQEQHKDIAKLKEEIEKLQIKKNNLEFSINQLNEDYEKTLKHLKSHPALKYIESFLEDKITYFVIKTDWNIYIETKKDALGKNNFLKDQKLLTLFGKSDGDFQWRVNDYSDGSGSWTRVFPCITLEDALTTAQKILSEIPETAYTNLATIEFAEKWDLKLPSWYKEKVKQGQLQSVQNQLEAALNEVSKRETDVIEMKKKWGVE